MLGVSFFELIVIMLVLLVVFGPQRLPEMARNLAKLFQQLQGVTDQFHSEIKELTKEKDNAKISHEPLQERKELDSDESLRDNDTLPK